jgi:membrane-bound lytic murein transglycosylase B
MTRAVPAALTAALLLVAPLLAQDPPPFEQWRAELMAEARTRGFDAALVTRALGRATPREQVIAEDRNQAEIVQTLDTYYASRVRPTMVDYGREMAATHAALLTELERVYGVPGQYLLAIWGMESSFGRFTGGVPVFDALVTLAWDPRRGDFFRSQIFEALAIVANGDVDIDDMTGSWAGAMGQTQFLPSNYLTLAVDHDGDGRRDIWTSTADSLASMANYLADGRGWTRGFTWGREVLAPAGLAEAVPTRATGSCPGMRRMTERRPLSAWQAEGVRRLDGGALPAVAIEGSLVALDGRTFLVYDNYDAFMRYNCVHRYALTVALFAEQLD